MLFNTWFGQVRPHSGVMGGYYYVPKRPIGKIQLRKLEKNGYNVQYEADWCGNMDIRAPEHVRDMLGLGYPIFDHYTGWVLPSFALPAPMTDGLIYPDNPAFDTKILEALEAVNG